MQGTRKGKQNNETSDGKGRRSITLTDIKTESVASHEKRETTADSCHQKDRRQYKRTTRRISTRTIKAQEIAEAPQHTEQIDFRKRGEQNSQKSKKATKEKPQKVLRIYDQKMNTLIPKTADKDLTYSEKTR